MYGSMWRNVIQMLTQNREEDGVWEELLLKQRHSWVGTLKKKKIWSMVLRWEVQHTLVKTKSYNINYLVTKLYPLCIGVHNFKGINHDLFLMKDLSILGNKTSLLSGIKLPHDVNSVGFLNMTIQNPHSLKFCFNEFWPDEYKANHSQNGE